MDNPKRREVLALSAGFLAAAFPLAALKKAPAKKEAADVGPAEDLMR